MALFRASIDRSLSVLNPNNVTVNANITDEEIAFAGATFTPDFTFPTTNSRPKPSSPGTVSPSPSAGGSSGLSNGAKAGIGVAAAALVAILIGICSFARQRCRTRKELGGDTKFQYPQGPSYPMKDLEVSVSHEELVANAAKPARGPIKEFTPNVSVHSLGWEVKETSI
jgi:hypothetical protein